MWHIFGNPAAGAGRALRLWPAHEAALHQQGVTHEIHWTTAAHEASALVAQAWQQGARRFIAMGGDGTVNEVLNGLRHCWEHPAGDERPLLGVLPAGTGNDWARQLALPRRPADWAAAVAAGHRRPHDVGRLRFADGRLHYFVVEAGAGFDTHVLGLLSRRGPRQLAYVLALLRGLASFRAPRLHLRIQGVPGRDDVVLGSERSMVAFGAIGPWTGGGMHIAPGARDDDGLLDFVTVRDAGAWHNLLNLPRLFNGRLHDDENVQALRGSAGELALEPPMAVQCDGQVVGMTPVRIELLPGVLDVPCLTTNGSGSCPDAAGC